MLLRKNNKKGKFLMLAVIFLLVLLIFPAYADAKKCEVGKLKQALRKLLYTYFTKSDTVPISREEVKDLLVFYLSISSQNATVDCTGLGVNSNRPIFNLVKQIEHLPDTIPMCPDSTKYGECSSDKPGYCFAGNLQSKCGLCGCPLNSVCGKSGKCESAQNITCSSNLDCGQNTFIGEYYCKGNYIAKDYLNYTCINPGTTTSRCVSSNSTILVAYCDTILNLVCEAGQSTCQTNKTDLAPTVAISVKPSEVNKGQAFNVTVAGTDDVGLAMIWWWASNTPDTELNKAHIFGCNGAKTCTNSWIVSTNAVGTWTLGANSRDTVYPVAGEPHQASEGAGIAYSAITVKDTQNATVDVTGLPDLVISDFSSYEGTTNTDILITATILNNGSGIAKYGCDGLYVETLNARGFCYGQTLMPGQTRKMQSAYALPVPGTFRIRADTDYGRQINESNEYNNVAWKTITVTSPYSAEYSKANTDLTVTDIDVQLPPSVTYTQVYVTTKNSGNLATGSYWVRTITTNLDTGAVASIYRLTPVVQPSETYRTYHGTAYITNYGNYKIEAYVDNNNYIPESDENNNYLSKTIVHN